MVKSSVPMGTGIILDAATHAMKVMNNMGRHTRDA